MLDLRLVLNSFAVLCCLFALWKGSRAERAAAIAVMANMLIGQISTYIAPSYDTEIRLVNDGLTALILLGVTVRYAALWMGGVMLFYAVQFAMHSFYIVMQKDPDYLRAVINNVDYAGIVLCLITGTIVAWLRRMRNARARATAEPRAPAT